MFEKENNKIKKLITILICYIIYKIDILNIFLFQYPLVSIIIPIKYGFNYSYDCIYSVLKSESSINYEIIVVDRTTTFLEKNFKNFSNIIFYNSKEDI